MLIIQLLQICERCGSMPSVLQAILSNMIPKHKAESGMPSFRSIGLCPGLYRFYARLRQSCARAWERSNQSVLLGHQSGRSIFELVFHQSLLCEAATADRSRPQYAAAYLWDFTNFYEFIERDLMWSRAADQELPLPVLAMCLNMYATRRFVGMGG